VGSSSDRLFSPSWVIASFLMICGGLAIAFGGAVAAGFRSELAAYVAFGAGAAIGGFAAGRASPHRSFLEPAIAGALVVLVILAFIQATPLGKLALALFPDTVTAVSLRLGGIGFAAGLVGAIAGEAITRGPPPAGALRWVWTSTLVTAGALLVASTAAGVILINEAAEQAIAQFFRGELGRRPLIEVERIAFIIAISTGAAAFVGGAITQMAAPRRLLLAAASGACLSVGGVVLISGAITGELLELALPAAGTGALAGLIALAGALLGRLVAR
jgi:hypothetical protein